MSMYAACFAQATFANDILAPKAGYSGPIDYILDDGNAYKDDVQVGYRELQRRGVEIGRSVSHRIVWTVLFRRLT